MNYEDDHKFLSHLFGFIKNIDIYKIQDQIRTVKIKNRFNGIPEYIRCFLPNFMNELAEFIDASLENMSVDQYYKVLVQRNFKPNSIFIGPTKDTKFQFLELMDGLSQGTLVLILRENPRIYPLKFSGWREIKVQASLMVFTGKKNINKVSLEWSKIGCPELEVNTIYYLIPLENLTTFTREVSIFKEINKMPLIEQIINPSPSQIRTISEPLEIYFRHLAKRFNNAQSKAIQEACALNNGFYLLQGPPGTGKTEVIIGLISGFMIKHLPCKPKILVCAPSNIAVNGSIARFFKNKILNDLSSTNIEANILRIGSLKCELPSFIQRKRADDRMSDEIKEIDLKSIVNNKIKELGYPTKEDINNLLKEIAQEAQEIEKTLKNTNKEKFKEERNSLIIKFRKAANRYEHTRKKRKEISRDLIHKADIIFCTLSSASNADLIGACKSFDYVIIDECCQSIELSSLLPLQHGCKVAVLIGDPCQLPATTFSKSVEHTLYNRSLFERLSVCGIQCSMLNIQYRMAPEICEFPSNRFYNSNLITDKSLEKRTVPTWMLSPGYLFIDHKESREQFEIHDTSPYNICEAQVVVFLLMQVLKQDPSEKNIGIISPYKKQVEWIKRLLEIESSLLNPCVLKQIEVKTVDGFQGREKDLIILSCVRTSNLGFLKDYRRMNVAITRAKFGLWIVGANKLLGRQESEWQELVEYHKRRNSFCDFFNLNNILKKIDSKRLMTNSEDLEQTLDVERESVIIFRFQELNNDMKGSRVIQVKRMEESKNSDYEVGCPRKKRKIEIGYAKQDLDFEESFQIYESK